jgi:hypothetical protein
MNRNVSCLRIYRTCCLGWIPAIAVARNDREYLCNLWIPLADVRTRADVRFLIHRLTQMFKVSARYRYYLYTGGGRYPLRIQLCVLTTLCV